MTTFEEVSEKMQKVASFKKRVAELEDEITRDLKALYESGEVDTTGRFSITVKNLGGKKITPNPYKLQEVNPAVYDRCLSGYIKKCTVKPSFTKTDIINAYIHVLGEKGTKVSKVNAERIMYAECGEEEDAEETYTLKDNKEAGQ